MQPPSRSRSLTGNKVNRRLLAILCCLLAVWLGWCVSRGPEQSTQPERNSVAAEATNRQAELEQAREQAVVEEQTRQQVVELAKLEREQHEHSELAIKQHERLMRLRASRADAWSQVLTTNWPVYQTLREKALNSREGTSPCTICNGRGSLPFCVVCEGNGKCLDCNGTGKTPFGERCPTCRGSGKCYLCRGSGKMPCLFCDDGLVYFKGLPPSTKLPLPGDPTPLSQPVQSSLIVHRQTLAAPPPTPPPAVETPAQPARSATQTIDTGGQTFGFAALMLLVGILAFRRLVPAVARFLNSRFDSWEPVGSSIGNGSDFLSDQQPLIQFAATFKAGDAQGSPELAEWQAVGRDTAAKATQRFFEIAPEHLESIKSSFSRVGRAQDETVRQKILGELSDHVRSFRLICEIPALREVFQLATALDGLLKQVGDRPSNVTPSALRTAAGAILLLETLSDPRVSLNRPVRPQLRLLAVDDDIISRKAVSLSLKKAFSEPDLAENGEAALALIGRNSYDVIFLDVEMPGMDGFELCTRIRQTELNRNTPVVFVTSHRDFESRTKSTQSGGQDLIGKPFLTFEITVKALTLLFRARLPGCPAQPTVLDVQPAKQPLSPVAAMNGEAAKPPIDAESSLSLAPPPLPPAATPPSQPPPQKPEANASHDPQPAVPESGPVDRNASAADSARQLPAAVPARLQLLRQQLQAFEYMENEGARQEVLGQLYVGLHALVSEAQRGELHSVCRLGSAVEKMLKKLLEHPKHFTQSALGTTVAALDLLEQICMNHPERDLAESPFHILVVDDDPMARRALACALQLGFGRPDSAESGEAAVVLATEKTFDVIFLDVMMPGMDGFVTCSRIRETIANRNTPIVFVTSLGGADSRDSVSLSGGNGLIPKPVLPAEIALAALTFGMRGRLHKLESANCPEPVPG